MVLYSDEYLLAPRSASSLLSTLLTIARRKLAHKALSAAATAAMPHREGSTDRELRASAGCVDIMTSAVYD